MRWLGMPKKSIPALYYREWRVNRGIYLAVVLLTVLPRCWSVLHNSLLPRPYAHEFLQSVVFTSATGDGGISAPFAIFLAGVLGLALFWNDRIRGGFDAALEGPLSRRALLGCKMEFGLASISAAQVFIFLLLLGTGLAVDHAPPIALLAAASLWTLVSGACLMIITLALGAVMSPGFVALGAVLWLMLPRVAASIINNTAFSGQRLTSAQSVALSKLVTNVRQFSPLLLNSSPAGGRALWFSLYFAAWAIAAAALALIWWQRAPYERMHDPFYFRWIWNLLYALLAILTGLLVAVLTYKLSSGFQEGFAIVWRSVVFAIPAWFGWRELWVRFGRSGIGWGPMSER